MYYQSGNKNKDAFDFNEFGTMVDFYQRLRTGRITFRETKSKLIRFSGLLDMLKSIDACKKSYKEKNTEVLKNADLLLTGQKLIYNGFMDGIVVIYIRLAEKKIFMKNIMMMMMRMMMMMVNFTL